MRAGGVKEDIGLKVVGVGSVGTKAALEYLSIALLLALPIELKDRSAGKSARPDIPSVLLVRPTNPSAPPAARCETGTHRRASA